MNILVVDDSQLSLSITEEYLKGFCASDRIFMTSNPNTVIDMIFENRIEIVFLNIGMPGKSGLDVLGEIKTTPELDRVHVIMIKSNSDMVSFLDCCNLGADDFLRKPIDVTELYIRLKAAKKILMNGILIEKINRELAEKNTLLEKMNKTLRETELSIFQQDKLASIGELAAGVAHEINNPIGFVSSNVEILGHFNKKLKAFLQAYRLGCDQVRARICPVCAKEVNSAWSMVKEAEIKNKVDFILSEMDPLLNDLLDGINRISKIVQTLRNFARTDLDENKAVNNVNEIIEESLLILKNEYKYSIDIEKDFDDNADFTCERGQMEQVFVNILMNAIQAIKSQEKPEKGKITIKTRSSGSELDVTISDDGPGIPEQIICRIFDPFFTTKNVGKGTGLGLSISYDIVVNKHGGRLYASTNPDGGTAFHIVIPATAGESGEPRMENRKRVLLA